jgi:hypothetical protein
MKTNILKIIRIALLLQGAFFVWAPVRAQITVGSDIEPAKGALLDVKMQAPDAGNITSPRGGIVLPRVRLIAINTLEPFIAPADPDIDDLKRSHTGLTVYNLSQTDALLPGLYVWNGQKWMKGGGSASASVGAGNGLSLVNSTLELGGTLTNETVIDQAGYNMGFTTGSSGAWRVHTNSLVVFGDNRVGIGDDSRPANARLAVGGNAYIDGKLAVEGSATLEKNVEIDGTLTYTYDGANNSGKYLMAIDNSGTAEWATPQIGTASTISGTATGGGDINTAGNTTANVYSANHYIALPPGKWLVKFSFLMKRATTSSNHQKLWVKLGFSRRTAYASAAAHEYYDRYRDKGNPSWPVYVECVLDGGFDYTSVTGDVVIDNTATSGFNNATEKLSRFDLTMIKDGEGLRPGGNASWNWSGSDLQLKGAASENMITAIKLD